MNETLRACRLNTPRIIVIKKNYQMNLITKFEGVVSIAVPFKVMFIEEI